MLVVVVSIALFGAFALTFNLNFSGHFVPLGWVDSKSEMVRRIHYIRHKAAI
jgi:hypothetical protein